MQFAAWFSAHEVIFAQMPRGFEDISKKEDSQYETQEKVEARRPSQNACHGGEGQPQAEGENRAAVAAQKGGNDA